MDKNDTKQIISFSQTALVNMAPWKLFLPLMRFLL